MPDHRSTADIVSDRRKEALVARLRAVDDLPDGHLWGGVAVITARDIEECFGEEVELDYAHRFEAETPADGWVDLICPNCGQAIPDVLVRLVAVMSKEGEGPTKVKLKLKAEAKVHVCGQIAVPRPVAPEVEGQVPAFEDAEDDDPDPFGDREPEDPFDDGAIGDERAPRR